MNEIDTRIALGELPVVERGQIIVANLIETLRVRDIFAANTYFPKSLALLPS